MLILLIKYRGEAVAFCPVALVALAFCRGSFCRSTFCTVAFCHVTFCGYATPSHRSSEPMTQQCHQNLPTGWPSFIHSLYEFNSPVQNMVAQNINEKNINK